MNSSLKFVLLSGLLVGTLDISAAFLNYAISFHKSPWIILKYIASGAFGKQAFSSGDVMYGVGLGFHYFIALSFTGFYFLIYPKMNLFITNWWLSGVLYAIFIWLVMNEIVIPLSLAPQLQIKFSQGGRMLKDVMILAFAIGLPLSFRCDTFFRRKGDKGNIFNW